MANGYVSKTSPRYPISGRVQKEQTLFPEYQNDELPIDVHQDLANRPWFHLSTTACFNDAYNYPSCDGMILSLSPEHQVLYAAIHYANHAMFLDDKHTSDIKQLLKDYSVNWPYIIETARVGGYEYPLQWLFGKIFTADAVPDIIFNIIKNPNRRLIWVASIQNKLPHSPTQWLLNLRDLTITTLLSSRPFATIHYLLMHFGCRLLDIVVSRISPNAAKNYSRGGSLVCGIKVLMLPGKDQIHPAKALEPL